jgi:hypothetical protein
MLRRSPGVICMTRPVAGGMQFVTPARRADIVVVVDSNGKGDAQAPAFSAQPPATCAADRQQASRIHSVLIDVRSYGPPSLPP